MARILVVDDDEQICALISRILENDGHQTTVEMSGVEALAALREGGFDLLLLDLVMPRKGGIETIMEIREISPGLPIIVVSGKVTFGDASITRLLQQYGTLAVLPKPFTSEQLRDAVDKALIV
ncbi:MAG TPA: response regulator [Spirochaetia bacterium]|nr:response regulator [Spirochaetia bacterium]